MKALRRVDTKEYIELMKPDNWVYDGSMSQHQWEAVEVVILEVAEYEELKNKAWMYDDLCK